MLRQKENEALRRQAEQIENRVRYKDEILSQAVFDSITSTNHFSPESVEKGNGLRNFFMETYKKQNFQKCRKLQFTVDSFFCNLIGEQAAEKKDKKKALLKKLRAD
jgi:hypothetical protein